MPDYIPSATPDDIRATLDTFTRGYLDAAEFTSRPDDGDDVQAWDDATFSAEAMQEARDVCAAFQQQHADDIADYGDSQAGHDLWMTRTHQGVGFWEEDHGTPEGCARMDAAAKQLGEVWLYVGDDGFLYFSR